MIRLTDGTELEFKRFSEMFIVFDRGVVPLSTVEEKVTTSNLKKFVVTQATFINGMEESEVSYKNFKVSSISLNDVEVTVSIMRQNDVEVRMNELEAENAELRECIKELTQELYK